MEYNRLEIIEKMESLERRKLEFENMLKDIENRYFKEVFICGGIKTQAFEKNYEGNAVVCNVDLFKIYVKEEIKWSEDEIKALISKLK